MKILRSILLILNVLAALALIATTLAGAVAPSKSILPSVFAYGFLPLLAVNVLFVLLWLLLRRWSFLISAAAIAARFSVVGIFLQVGGTSEVPSLEEHPGRIVLMSYNLHNFGGVDFESTPKDSNAKEFLLLLREQQPDVLCLQEYAAVKGMSITDSLELMGYNHYYGARGSNTAPSGTVVFSKFPITYVKKIDQQKLLVELLHGERPFRLLCVHMNSYSFDLDDREEIEQLRHGKVDSISHRTLAKAKGTVLRHEEEWNSLLRPLVCESSLPLLMAGDMNDIPASWLYFQISKYLRDAFRDEGNGLCSTYNGSFPRFRIDMVFHSPEFTTLSYRRLKSRISDHFPVIVSLELAECKNENPREIQ